MGERCEGEWSEGEIRGHVIYDALSTERRPAVLVIGWDPRGGTFWNTDENALTAASSY